MTINTNLRMALTIAERLITLSHLCEFVKHFFKGFGDPYRIRTDVNGVRGRCLNHLTNGPLVHLQGLEPGTH